MTKEGMLGMPKGFLRLQRIGGWVDGSMWAFCWSYRCNFPELLRNDNMMAKVTRPRPVPSGLDLGLLMLWFWFVILWRFSFIHASVLVCFVFCCHRKSHNENNSSFGSSCSCSRQEHHQRLMTLTTMAMMTMATVRAKRSLALKMFPERKGNDIISLRTLWHNDSCV